MQKKVGPRAARILGAVLTALAALVFFGVRWLLDTWQHLSMDELAYHLTASLTGADRSMVLDFAVQCLLPALLVLPAGLFLYRRMRHGALCGAILLIVSLTGSFLWLDARVQVVDYLRSQGEDSDFIAQHYADPAQTKITFPSEKRNLVYIFLESMETTYADAQSGGAMERNLIPNLTRIAQENEDFSGPTAELNGGRVLFGSTWTMGAMFAHTAGLPLKVSVEGNSMGTQEHFSPAFKRWAIFCRMRVITRRC